MKKNGQTIGRSLGELTLPIFPLFSHSIFPHTFFLIKPGPESSQKTIIERVCNSVPPLCIVVIQDLNKKTTDANSFSKIGVVSRVEASKEGFNFFAEYRAKIESLAYFVKQGFWKADVSRLPDVPEMAELNDSHTDLPMILGCVESIFRLLVDLRPLVKEEELAKKLEGQIKKLKVIRREKDTAYFLPWHVLIDFGYLQEETKEKMLRANSVMERLQILIDILKSEIRIFRNAEILVEYDPKGLVKNGGK